MPKLNEYIDINSIDLHLKAESELEAIVQMINLAERSGYILDKKQIGEDLISHEIFNSSLTDCCTVVFRVSTDSVKDLHVFFGRFEQGIGYYSKNGHPIDLVFLVLSPPQLINRCKTLVSKIKTLLHNFDFQEKLRSAHRAEDVLQALNVQI